MNQYLCSIIAMVYISLNCIGCAQNEALRMDAELSQKHAPAALHPIFKEMANVQPYLETGFYEINKQNGTVSRIVYNPKEGTVNLGPSGGEQILMEEPLVSAQEFKSVLLSRSSITNDVFIAIQMNEEGSLKWRKGTQRLLGQDVAIVIDNVLISVVRVMGVIDSGKSAISGFDIHSPEDMALFRQLIQAKMGNSSKS